MISIGLVFRARTPMEINFFLFMTTLVLWFLGATAFYAVDEDRSFRSILFDIMWPVYLSFGLFMVAFFGWKLKE
jgi:hypothetical protein